MRIYVINLARRADRRAAMQAQADAAGLALTFCEAVDARSAPMEVLRSLSEPGPLGALSEGDLCCTLSHRKVWRMIADGDAPYGVVLEDDVALSEDAGDFLASYDWIPEGTQLVKLERFGNRRHKVVMGPAVAGFGGRRLRRIRSKYVGAAGYVISREAAEMLWRETEIVRLPVDHVLFNPNNSPLFGRLKPLAFEPALVQQGVNAESDIHGFRLKGRTGDLAYWWRETVRGYYELRLVPLFAALLLTGRGELVKPSFDGGRLAPAEFRREGNESESARTAA